MLLLHRSGPHQEWLLWVMPTGSRARQKLLNYRAQSLQRSSLLCRDTNGRMSNTPKNENLSPLS